MDAETLVYVDLAGAAHLVGRLWARARKNKEGATFEYDGEWLKHPARFSLEPALTLGPGPFHTGDGVAMFGAIGDSAPDRWGRALMRRMERRRADREGQTPRALREIRLPAAGRRRGQAGRAPFRNASGRAFSAGGRRHNVSRR